MSNEVRIVQWDDQLKQKFSDFTRLVHPHEQDLDKRMQWFTFANPALPPGCAVPGLVIVKGEEEIIGQFLACPFEFYLRGTKHLGYFGYDFFVREEYRSRGAGALLFMQGVRLYAPFVGVGLTPVVERISKAAGIQIIAILKKFLWVRNPVSLGSQLFKPRVIGNPQEKQASVSGAVFPDVLDVSGLIFQRKDALPPELAPSTDDEVLEPSRSGDFLKWRFGDSPWSYCVYTHQASAEVLWLVVRPLYYQGMRLIFVVDHRFPSQRPASFEIILKAAKRICEDIHFDGVLVASTHLPIEEAFKREGFLVTGRPSSVITYLPSEQFTPAVKAIHLTAADSDLDFTFASTQ